MKRPLEMAMKKLAYAAKIFIIDSGRFLDRQKIMNINKEIQ